MSSDCCTKVALHDGEPQGSFIELFGSRAYVVGDLSTTNTKEILVMFSDIYGFSLKNNLLVADKLSKYLNITVVFPDILKNDDYTSDQVLQEWFKNHQAEETGKFCEGFLRNLKANYANLNYLIAIGYCYGAKFVVENLKKDGLLDAGAVAHPSLLNENDISSIAKPIIFAAAEFDPAFTQSLRWKTEEILSKNKVRYEIDLYSHVSHGFAVKGDLSIPEVKYAADKALCNAVDWFKFFKP